jgi:hypothetical protein
MSTRPSAPRVPPQGSRPDDRVCIEDPPIAAVEPAEIESLRYGLNAIARWLR